MPTLPIHCQDGRTTHLDLSDPAYALGYINCLRDLDQISGPVWESIHHQIEHVKDELQGRVKRGAPRRAALDAAQAP